MTNLTILSNKIRTLDNLYSLNDLHFASGNDPKHRPSLFIRLETTKELVAEISKEVRSTDLIFKTLRGRNIQGTYACEELALAYATWISPKFHLVVLRAFIAMHKNKSLQNTQEILPVVEEPKPDVVMPHEEAVRIAKYIVRARAFAKEVEVFHRKLHEQLGIPRYIRNDLAAKGYDIAHEFNTWLDPFVNQTLPESVPNKPMLELRF